MEETVETTIVDTIKENWKPLAIGAAVATVAIVGGVAAYKYLAGAATQVLPEGAVADATLKVVSDATTIA